MLTSTASGFIVVNRDDGLGQCFGLAADDEIGCAIDDHAQSVTYQSIAAGQSEQRLWDRAAVDPTLERS